MLFFVTDAIVVVRRALPEKKENQEHVNGINIRLLMYSIDVLYIVVLYLFKNRNSKPKSSNVFFIFFRKARAPAQPENEMITGALGSFFSSVWQYLENLIFPSPKVEKNSVGSLSFFIRFRHANVADWK